MSICNLSNIEIDKTIEYQDQYYLFNTLPIWIKSLSVPDSNIYKQFENGFSCSHQLFFILQKLHTLIQTRSFHQDFLNLVQTIRPVFETYDIQSRETSDLQSWLNYYEVFTSLKLDKPVSTQLQYNFSKFTDCILDAIQNHKDVSKIIKNWNHSNLKPWEQIIYLYYHETSLETFDKMILEKYNRDLDLKRLTQLYVPKTLSKRTIEISTNKCGDGNHNYLLCNPSVVTQNGNWIVSCRGVNYIRNGDVFHIFDPKGHIHSENYILYFDSQETFQRFEILELQLTNQLYPCPYTGIEDIRMIDHDWFTGTFIEITPYCRATICLFHRTDNQVDQCWPLKGLTPGRPEKNWLPFRHKDKILAIYSHQPFTILEINPINGETTILKQREYNGWDFSQFRGSAAPIPYELNGKSGYLYSVHEVVYNGVHQYWNRNLWMNEDLEIEWISLPYRFNKDVQIEMMTGFSVKENVVSSWIGVNDRCVERWDQDQIQFDQELMTYHIV